MMELARDGVSVDLEAVQDALALHGLDVLTSGAQNVRRLRIHFLGLIEECGEVHESVGQCGTCDERFTEDPEARRGSCPFCGSSFGDDEVVEALATCRTITDLIELGVRHAEAGRKAMWDLGVFLAHVQAHELWRTPDKAGDVPFKSFREFHERVGVAHRMAYELIKLARLSSRDDFLRFGRTKLTVLTKIAPGPTKDAVDQAMRGGASRRDMEKMAGDERTDEPAVRPESPAESPSARPTVTIVASVEPDKPQKLGLLRFRAVQGRDPDVEELGDAVELSVASGCYGELEISSRVFVQIGVEIVDGKVSLHTVFRESPEED